LVIPHMGTYPVDEFLGRVVQWGNEKEDISAILLVGSHARGEARPDSDVDLVILVGSPGKYLNDLEWLGRFGNPINTSIEDWGNVQSLRVWFEGDIEVEFGFTSHNWLSQPLDPGTHQVLSEGYRFLIDKPSFRKILK